MRILLTGGTGLIGRALCAFWLEQGHELLVWSRRPEQVEPLCGKGVRGVASLQELGDIQLDAVINLAGAPIADRPWTAGRRRLLRDSRIRLTDELVGWMAQLSQAPPLLISGSAIGWYGDTGEQLVTEESTPGTRDFGSELCEDWEQAARKAEAFGVRVVRIRTALVLAPSGGFLARLRPLFALGLGGRLGNGRQWMSWVHLDDKVALIDHLLHLPDAQGPYNTGAPNPVRNSEFTRQLATQLKRPAFMHAPAFVLRMLLGEMSGLLLGGQRIQPVRLQESGFSHRYPELEGALADVLRRK